VLKVRRGARDFIKAEHQDAASPITI